MAPSSPPGASLQRRLAFRLVLIFFGLFAAGVLAAAVTAVVLAPTLPPVHNILRKRLKAPLQVLTRHGQLIAEFGNEERMPVTLKQVPTTLVKAILAAEDRSFYTNPGIDLLGIARAAWVDIVTGRKAQGASTITMQVARNYFLSPRKTFTRKIKEVLLSFKIARELTKNQILTLYLNKIFLGNHAYGFEAAAHVYYGKPLKALHLAQLAMLAGLPQAPSLDNPIDHPHNARARRQYVLQRMLALGDISQAQYAKADAAPITTRAHSIHYRVQAPYVAEMVREYMVKHFGKKKTYNGGYRVYTTLGAHEQRAADRAVIDGLLAYNIRHGYYGPTAVVPITAQTTKSDLRHDLRHYTTVGGLIPAIVTAVGHHSIKAYDLDHHTVQVGWQGLSWAAPFITVNAEGYAPQQASDILKIGDIIYLWHHRTGQWALSQIPRPYAALVSLRPHDGSVAALVGGFDFYHNNFNNVTQAYRQPGSSFKPFVYSAAIAKGYTAASLFSGAPIVALSGAHGELWRPHNYSDHFRGLTRMRVGLAQSINLVSIRILRAVGIRYAIRYATRFGFKASALPHSLSLVLGSATLTPLEMARGYTVFANGGFRIRPYFIRKIVDERGKTLWRARPLVVPSPEITTPVKGTPHFAVQAISPQNAYIMTSMMQSVIRSGTGQRALSLRRIDLAGKTGTSNHERNAWFSGFSPYLETTAWMGFPIPKSLGHYEVGANAALPIWIQYMGAALAGRPDTPFPIPRGIVTAIINRHTGLPCRKTNPAAMVEYFIKGTVPKKGAHRGVPGPAQSARSSGLF
ncbi:penicillin-binding protein 1A [Acidiferrobacter sp.]|uniref:penicillin-binding protein 1A n=1 Tax=Acidiferrobacter sp. TaxID=1872107 RepID=UPI00261B2203|nr:PBP1A family penicillin-binding protein [Acidiferrobacter sp.]